MTPPKPLVLIILDGWGYAPPSNANAISLARKPNYDRLLAEYPNTLIHTSGRYVGLPTGQMGNSEVGHLNIGAGRVVYMDITKIDLMIENGEFYSNPVLLDAMTSRRAPASRRLHLFGLLSDGGVHSHQNHLYALLRMAKQNGVERVFVHCFMDGRDTLPTNGAGYIEQLQQKMREYGVGKIATVSGRYYAMDRDRRWEREKKAFDAMVVRRCRRWPLHRPRAGREGLLQPGSHRRVHHSLRAHRRSRRAAGQHSRRRCLHQLQLPRRPRPADHALPGPQQPLHAAGWPRTGRRGRSRPDDSARPRAQRPAPTSA